MYKKIFLIKKVFYLLDTFFGGFFFKPTVNKSFLCLHFNICFKIKLVLPLRFKVINVKNLHPKNLKGEFYIFQLINFCNCRIPKWQLYLCNIFSLQKRLNDISLLFLFSSLFGKI